MRHIKVGQASSSHNKGEVLLQDDRAAFLAGELGIGLRPAQADDVIRSGCARLAAWPAGPILHRHGDPQPTFLLVLRGRVEVVRTKPDGGSQLLDWVRAGECCGAVTAFGDEPHWIADVRLVEPTRALVIDTSALIDQSHRVDACLTVLENCRRVLARRGSLMVRRVELLTYRGMRERLAFLLLRDHKEGVVNLAMTRKQLADSIYVSRTSMTRELGRMVDDGLIRIDGRRIELLDVPALRLVLSGS